ncbi:MAG TPA: TonB-dependent receptor [Saprospiraceae bacterium]|nr:TonB-dependent receptor [Saprospiraceae bacterium]
MYKIKTLFTCIFTVAVTIFLAAQQNYSISGIVKDSKTGELMIGARIYLLETPKVGTVSNAYGFYSITAPSGNYTLIVGYAGYKQDSIKINLDKNLTANVDILEQVTELQEVVISSTKQNENVAKPLMGVQKLTVNEIKNVAVIFGEKDVLKTIQLLPGIKSTGEGSSGFYVRGGGADQNLILLDEATVYNASHLLGFFSSFNSDAIKDLTVYKGAMPAEYGGRLSSVVDIKMNDGNNKEYHASGGIGLIASRLTFEGPIVKDKGSFIISGRRTYADLYLKLSSDNSTRKSSLYFYDLNLKANYKINDKNRVYLSGYFGKDDLGLGGIFGIDYGNSTATARWNHIFNSRLFSNTTLIYSNYNYNIRVVFGNNDIIIKSKIEDISLKQDFQYFLSNNNKINFGFNIIKHKLNPGVIDASAFSNFNSLTLQSKNDYENAVYISHEFTLSDKINLNYGIRISSFMVMGPGNFYTYDSSGFITKTNTYSSGQIVKTYFNLEPRFSGSYQINENNSFKISYTRNIQNLHLLSNSATTNPTDIWIPSSLNVKPEIADQIAMGYYKNLRENSYEFSSEIYYKALQNQIDYKNGAELRANDNVESDLLFGKGRAYGLELFLKKKTGKLTGWISYTLAKVEKQIPGINNGEYYVAKQDQTHNIAIVGIYQLNKKWTLSANWVYNTGNAATFPSGKYTVNGQTAFYYTERNGYRFPSYHRLDFSATVLGKQHKKWEGSWTFSLYNVYGRQNAYSIRFEDNPDDPSRTQAVQTSLFRWVPSITYNFKF